MSKPSSWVDVMQITHGITMGASFGALAGSGTPALMGASRSADHPVLIWLSLVAGVVVVAVDSWYLFYLHGHHVLETESRRRRVEDPPDQPETAELSVSPSVILLYGTMIVTSFIPFQIVVRSLKSGEIFSHGETINVMFGLNLIAATGIEAIYMFSAARRPGERASAKRTVTFATQARFTGSMRALLALSLGVFVLVWWILSSHGDRLITTGVILGMWVGFRVLEHFGFHVFRSLRTRGAI